MPETLADLLRRAGVQPSAREQYIDSTRRPFPRTDAYAPPVAPRPGLTRRRTQLPPQEEARFQQQYARLARRNGLDPNPDAPEHRYDYRGALRSGASSGADGHWPSEFKDRDHPARYLTDDAGVPYDTATDQNVPAWMLHANLPAQRPRPRQMRPIEQRQNDPNAGVRLQAQQQAMRGLGAQRSQGALQRDLGRAEAYDPAVDPNTGLSQGQEALLMNLEITGGPSLVRSYRSFERGDMGGGFMHGGLGALAVLGNSTLSGPARRAGQARGALARPEPPFDTRTRYYHGMHGTVEDGPGAWDGGALRPTQGGRYGDAVYLSPSRATADQYASLLRSHGRADRPGDVIEAHVRGRFASESRFQAELNRAGGDKATAVARLRRAGFAGVRAPGENQIAVFDPADVRVVSPPPARPEPFPDFGTPPPRPAPRGLDAGGAGAEQMGRAEAAALPDGGARGGGNAGTARVATPREEHIARYWEQDWRSADEFSAGDPNRGHTNENTFRVIENPNAPQLPTAGAGPPKPTQNKSYAARRKAGFFMPERR